MISKRHLLTIGSVVDTELDMKEEKEKNVLGMGEEEQWEAIRNNTLAPRTWWRKWLNIK